MKFRLLRACKKDGTIKYETEQKFYSLDDLFNFLASQGHQTSTVTVHNATTNPRVAHTTASDQANFDIVYESLDADEKTCTVQLEADGECYYVQQIEYDDSDDDDGDDDKDVTFSQFSNAHRNWAREQATPILGEEVKSPAFLPQPPP